MNASTVPVAHAINDSFINSKLATISFQLIKNYFKINDLVLNAFHECQFTTYDETTNKLTFSSTEFMAVLMYSLNHIIKQFINIVNNDDLTDDLALHLNRVNLSRHSSINSFYSNLLYSQSFENYYFVYIEFIKLIYNSIKAINKRRSNAFNDSSHLKIVLMSHEFFDSFKAALNDYLDEFHDGNIDNLQFYDVDSIPYHKLKKSIIPRNQNINTMFYNFIYPDYSFYYSHQVQDFQIEEFEPENFNGSLDQLLVNLINDCNFYIRFLPTNWANPNVKPADILTTNKYNLHSSNITLKCILRRHGLID